MKKLIALTPALLLAGCISFGAKPPPSLLTLTSATALQAGTSQSSASASTIAIAEPATPQEIGVTRVPVRSSDTQVAYVKDAVWVEVPARLFARLLGDTITARTGRVVVAPAGAPVLPTARLEGDLRNFGMDEAGLEAVVTYDAALQRGENGALERRRFESRVPVTAIDATTVGPALNQAANTVATEVADWVGR